MIKNEIVLYNGYVEIIVKSKNYVHKVLLDIEDLPKVGKIRISNTGYAYQCCTKANRHRMVSTSWHGARYSVELFKIPRR